MICLTDDGLGVLSLLVVFLTAEMTGNLGLFLNILAYPGVFSSK
jgi:hypothetical protein